MTRKEKPVRVERGLYIAGRVYLACATPPGSRTVRWKTIGEIGLMAARVARDAWVTEVKAGRAPKTGRKTVREVGDLWLAYLEDRVETGALGERTLEAHKTSLRLHILPAYGDRDVRLIDAEDLVEWHRDQRSTGAARWSIRARWMAWRGLLAFAARRGWRQGNPADDLLPEERPKPGEPAHRYLSRQEIEALLAAAEGDGDRDLIAIGVFTGMRASEMLGVILGEIDYEQHAIHLRYQMSRKGKRVRLKTAAGVRDIVLMSALEKILRRRRLRMLRSADADLLLQSSTGSTMGYWTLQDRFAGMAERAGLEDVTPHAMRHTFASILISEGRTVEFVSRQLGHAHTSTTLDTYSHLFDQARHAKDHREGLEESFGAMLAGTKQGLST